MRSLSIAFSLLLLVGLQSCTGIQSTTRGLENQAFISVVSESDYPDGVSVIIDGEKSFKAEVGESNTKRPKGTVYAISTGKHQIQVKDGAKLLYAKQVFLSNQETRQIILP